MWSLWKGSFITVPPNTRSEFAWSMKVRGSGRPGTPDSLPVLGPDPELEGLLYATGHYRNGILLAPLTADCLAALATGRPPQVELTAFAPDRSALTAWTQTIPGR